MNDSSEYIEKKKLFDSMITMYGRNVAVEILKDPNVEIYRLHLSKSNREDDTIREIMTLAQKRNVEIKHHTKEGLSRISKNGAQDQGVAIDVITANYKSSDHIPTDLPGSFRLLALDGIHNPQNLGMIIRSAAASKMDGIVLPKKNSTKLSPLVMKASAGTMFKIPIYYCQELEQIIDLENTALITLSSHAADDIYSLKIPERSVFILGNETEGVSENIMNASTHQVSIPMFRGVESLNVAVTAGIVSFLP